MKRVKKIIIIIIFFLLIGTVLAITYCFREDKSVSFIVDKNSNENIKILVEGEPVEIKDNIITPITLTTVRPVTITIENTTKKVRLKNLSKKHFVNVNIEFKDKTENYLLATLPSDFPKLNINNKTNQRGYVLMSLIVPDDDSLTQDHFPTA